MNAETAIADGTASTDIASKRGRPQDADRTAAILDATNDLLHEGGYDALRVQDVARQAGTGLATIYRRWSTKEELVAAAMAAKAEVDYPTTGDPETDLHTLTEALAAEMGIKAEFIAGLISAIRSHKVIGDALRCNVIEGVRARFKVHIEAILGPDNPNIDLLIDSIPANLLYRATVLDEVIVPSEYADEVLTLVRSLR